MLCERKRGTDHTVSHQKRRYFARGGTHLHLVEYVAVWVPVAHHATLRAVLVVSACNSWALGQLGMKTALLSGVEEEEVYVRQLERHERGGRRKICVLQALYCLK